ncbi:MAG: InlB B-repeat-containing protein [Bacteroidota bacterium]|nr:InlB B-repeat-containing protein [Bacteroidota bacterium]
MKKSIFRLIITLFTCLVLLESLHAVTPIASIRVNSSIKYQKITGFGGFVCSPTFAYNHMSTDEIKKLWGKNSEAGYNIMRLYIPVGTSSWSQSLATAQLAKSLGITVFASPWSMPAEWKAYNTVNAIYTDANGVTQDNYLLASHYADYANYLNDYVTYLHNNGVELDAISIQNEPDMRSSYAGCIWTPQQIADFVKNYGQLINCKVIAPESVGLTDNYANAFLDDNVCANFEIYGGHQYGNLQSGFKQVQAKGKEAWMTEYLINWNADENTTRDFNWKKDAFSFATKLNTALLGNVNAWIHYASKRYYGLMGDGSNGTTTGAITKRGYILSHYAKYSTGSTRVDQTFMDATGKLSGSSYLSVTGDSVIVMVINPADSSYNLTVDLPFYTKSGNSVKTSESVNMSSSVISLTDETCRPKLTIDPSCVTTLIFVKSSERPASQMTGAVYHYNKIEDQTVTNTSFGTSYQLSGKTATFDNSHLLISTNTTSANGYLKLDDRYNQLVFHIDNISSAMNYTSANTTLYYVNSNGEAKSYNYGTISFDKNGNYDWVLDISRKVLIDGCSGILGLSNSNYSSVLTIKFGDVFFRLGTEKMFKFAGIYSIGDSNELDCLDNASYTSLDYTNTTGITSSQNWYSSASNKNCIYYTDNSVTNSNANVIAGTTCSKLSLTEAGGNFYAPVSFSATAASYTRTVNGYGMLTLPFEATIPSGIKAYTLQYSSTEISGTKITSGKISANTPVLIAGSGTFSFDGTGSVSTPHNLKVNDMNAVYVSVNAPAGSYYLASVSGATAFYKVTSGSEPAIAPFGAYLTPGTTLSASSLTLKLDGVTVNTGSVSFNTNGGSSIADLIVNYNSTITAPTAPIKTGYVFAGWFKDAACTNAWNFATDVVTASITLYAKWTSVNTGVNNATAGELSIYPNPARDVLYINSTLPIKSGEIFDIQGKRVAQLVPGKNQVDISHLLRGVYVIKITGSGKTIISKFIKE